MALAQFLLILAYDQASAAALSPFNYSVVVFSGLIGWLVWDQVPNALSLVGVVLVCAGGVLATRQRRGATSSPPTPATRSATRSEQTMSTSAVECVVRAEAIVGESPVWSPRDKALYWVDITGQKIHRCHPDSGANDTFELPEPVTAVGLREKGGLVVTLRKDFALYDPATKSLRRLSDPEADRPDNRFNDAKCDRRGRFWAGTMAAVKWAEPAGSLYRLDPDARVTRIQGDCVCANGLGWSPDNRTFYFTESFRYAVFAYDFDADTGAISNRRLFASVDKDSGAFPDGLTVDAEGCVWSVHNAVGRVVRYTPAGKIDRVVEVPVPRPCSCIFGGEKLDVLYITTARETLTAEQIARWPLSGSVFALRPGVCGIPEPYFAG
jgi:sugar lactone lactonase YvrE